MELNAFPPFNSYTRNKKQVVSSALSETFENQIVPLLMFLWISLALRFLNNPLVWVLDNSLFPQLKYIDTLGKSDKQIYHTPK